jgi:hypothetical protein
MNELFNHRPQCAYEPQNSANLAAAISRQLDARTTVDVDVPSWADSAKEPEAFFETIFIGSSTTQLKSSPVTAQPFGATTSLNTDS